jgi:glycosyltransferase involved in cell wall biosynthesis
VLLSPGDVDRAIQYGFPPNKLTFMFNFIDETKFEKFNKRDFKKAKQILVVGNLDNVGKQFDHVLRAFSIIDKEIRAGWKVKIIGGGSAMNSLTGLAKSADIFESVCFAGKKSDPTIDFFESDFYVLSSSFEGFPLTLLECIFSNLPIVSYACSPAIQEIITNDVNGFIVEKNDVHGLSKAIQYLITNDDVLTRMSANQEMFKRKFGSHNAVEKWENLLFPALTGKT